MREDRSRHSAGVFSRKPLVGPSAQASRSPGQEQTPSPTSPFALSTKASERLDQLEAESRARCVRRWCALGLTRDEALALYHDPSIGVLSTDILPTAQNPIKLIQAPMGTGKSLAGEHLHKGAFDRFRREADTPVPVYLETRPPAGGLREAVITASSNLGDPATRGAAIVVDDQLGVDSASVWSLLDDARFLVEVWPRTTFTVLSRPLPDDQPPTEAVHLPLLLDDEIIQLVKRLNGHLAYDLPLSLREAIRRPLFAILLAIATRRQENEIPRSTGELLAGLVRRALGQRIGDQSPLQDVLERLSIAILARGGPLPVAEALSPAEVPPLVASGLIIQERATVRFALDILLEWFAAQAFAKGHVQPEQFLNDERLLERWFFGIAMFLAGCSHANASLVLEPLVRAYPTLASQVVVEAMEDHNHRALFQEDETQPPAFDECGRRLRETMQAWADGLGPLARLVAPLDERDQVLPVGVAVGRSLFARSWYQGTEPKPPVVELPSQLVETSPFSPANRDLPGLGWGRLMWSKSGSSPAWMWNETRAQLSRNLAELVRVKGFPFVGELHGGPLWKEIVWLAGLWVMGYGSFWMQPLPLDALEDRLEQLPEAEGITRYGSRTVSLEPLRQEIIRLRAQGASELAPPYPGPDDYSPNGWWRDRETGEKRRPEPYITVGSSWYDNFSEEGLAAHIGAIYGAALQGYEQLIKTWLPTLAPHLTTAVLLPVRLVGLVEHPWHRGVWGASIDWYLDPLPASERSRVEVRAWRPEDGDSYNFRSDELMASLRRHQLMMRPRTARWLVTSLNGSAVSLGDTPALDLAYDWLQDDLKRARWI